MSRFLDRRQFVALLFSCTVFPYSCPVEAKNEQLAFHQAAHFYWLDLQSSEIFLPKDGVIENGQPGSIMKLVATAALLEENRPAASQLVDCRGVITLHGQTYVCRHPHGRISLVEALGQSCNVFFAHAADEIGGECFLHYLKRFGLEQKIISARLKNSSSTSFHIALILGIADRFILSAMQIMQLTASIATRGKSSILHYDNKVEQEIIIPKIHLAEHTWNTLQTGMHVACQRGTAKNLDPLNKLHIAAKTGTAIHGNTFQSWLTGYFPYECPRYVFCLRAPNGTSYDRAVPEAKNYLFARHWT